MSASLPLVAIAPQAQETGVAPTLNDVIKQGRSVEFDRKKGDCLACHATDGGVFLEKPAPLITMKARFPDKTKLRAKIANATERNPNSIMPPFEKHGVLTNEKVDQITEFVYTLNRV